MNQQTILTIQECLQASENGTLRFPDIVSKLIQENIEQYRADLIRAEITYYHQNDETYVASFSVPAIKISRDFSAPNVAAAVKAAQSGLPFKEFLPLIMKAGCIGYNVCITGKRVVYFGRTGDSHTEYFPQ